MRFKIMDGFVSILGLNFEEREKEKESRFKNSYVEKRSPKWGLISDPMNNCVSLACTPYHPGCPSQIYVSSQELYQYYREWVHMNPKPYIWVSIV